MYVAERSFRIIKSDQFSTSLGNIFFWEIIKIQKHFMNYGDQVFRSEKPMFYLPNKKCWKKWFFRYPQTSSSSFIHIFFIVLTLFQKWYFFCLPVSFFWKVEFLYGNFFFVLKQKWRPDNRCRFCISQHSRILIRNKKYVLDSYCDQLFTQSIVNTGQILTVSC